MSVQETQMSSLLADAESEMQRRHWDEAYVMVEAVLQQEPNNALAQTMMAKIISRQTQRKHMPSIWQRRFDKDDMGLFVGIVLIGVGLIQTYPPVCIWIASGFNLNATYQYHTKHNHIITQTVNIGLAIGAFLLVFGALCIEYWYRHRED